MRQNNESENVTIEGAYVPPIDLNKLEVSLNKHDTNKEFQQPPLEFTSKDPKDAQIEALAYLLIGVCLPALDYYTRPQRHGTKTIEQVRKANIARRVLKDAGF